MRLFGFIILFRLLYIAHGFSVKTDDFDRNNRPTLISSKDVLVSNKNFSLDVISYHRCRLFT